MIRKFRREAESLALKAARKIDVADQLMAGRLAKSRAGRAVPGDDAGLKYSMVPTVAAVDGLALGGGCEFVMHSARAVATLESYIGLVEVGVGLLPAGGGCKEIRAARRGGSERRRPVPVPAAILSEAWRWRRSAQRASTRASSAICDRPTAS